MAPASPPPMISAGYRLKAPDAGQLSGLFVLLDDARRRWRVAAWLDGIVASLLAMLVAFSAVQVVGIFANWLGHGLPLPRRTAGFLSDVDGTILLGAAIGGVVFVASLAVYAFATGVRAPDRLGAARILEGRVDLKDRLSAALEQVALPQPVQAWAQTLRQALFADAGETVGTVDLAKVAPIGLPRFAWLTPILLALTMALASVQVATRPEPTPQAASQPPALSQEERETTATTLKQIADIIRKDAEVAPAASEKKPYLDALARTADSLIGDTQDNAVQRQDLTQALSQLADQATQAYSGDRRAAAFTQISGLLQDQIVALADAGQAKQSQEQAPPSTADTPARAPDRAPAERTSSTPPPTDQAAVVSPQDPDATRPGGSYYVPDQQNLNRQQAERTQMQTMGMGTPVGAADDAGKGGDQAGDGVRPFAPDLLDYDSAGQRTAEAVVLPQEDASAGQSIRIDTAPPDVNGAAIASEAAAQPGGWQGASEQPLQRDARWADDPGIIQRYFQSGTEP